MSLRLRQRPDRSTHSLICNLDKPIRDLVQSQLLPSLRPPVHFFPDALECGERSVQVEGVRLGLAEYLGKEVGDETAKDEVRVRYCQSTALPGERTKNQRWLTGGMRREDKRADALVACRPRIRTRTLRPRREEPIPERQARATASCDGIDIELR